jgi:CubicO group peptidase (beta-lactamase class C family)
MISDLLFQISGLSDAFEEGKNSIRRFSIPNDVYIDFMNNVDMVRKLKPHFVPRTENKAHYADINFDLLGKVVENVVDLPLEEVYKRFIIEPLELKNTYLPISENEFIPEIYFKDKLIHRPKIVISSRASGGGVSTAYDLMIFIKAFFGGKLFNKEIFKILSKYKKLQASMGPIYYGGGYMQIPLEGSTTLFMGKGELIGHSGSTGSFAFYYPYKDIYITGNINQAANQALPIRFVMKLAMTLGK